MKEIKEKSRHIPIYGEYDVTVCGGGIAGVSSALAAARNGAKTLLIEKACILGGLATAGLVTIYLPLCDGNGTQVSFGIAEELFRLSIKHGYEQGYPDAWLAGNDIEARKKQRFKVHYNAYVFAILCEELLRKNGVEILYDTSVCSADVDNDRISAVYIENRSGRQVIISKTFIDCTGDAYICKLADEKTGLFSDGNILAAWYYRLDNNRVKLKMFGAADTPAGVEEEKLSDKRYGGVDGREVSLMLQDSHRMLLADFLKDGGVTDEHMLTTVASIPQLRKTRRLVSDFELDVSDDHKRAEDSIGMISDWRHAGPIYEVPFSCLHGKIKNLLVAGRCISVTDAMWEYSRVIPACAVTGEACGTAAAMFDDFSDIRIGALQERLAENGVKLHL